MGGDRKLRSTGAELSHEATPSSSSRDGRSRARARLFDSLKYRDDERADQLRDQLVRRGTEACSD